MTRLLIAGRFFRTASKRTTLRHDLATEAQIMRAGLNTLEIFPEEEPANFVERVSSEALHDRHYRVLIVPHSTAHWRTKWTLYTLVDHYQCCATGTISKCLLE